MKRIGALTLMLLILVAVPFGSVDRDIIVEWQKALVYCNYHSQSITTGFFVSPDGIIATALHLVKDWVIFVNGFHIFVVTHEKNRPYKARVLGFNQKQDILFLQINYRPKVWFDKFEDAKNGQACIALGFPYGWRIALEAKIITNFRSELMGIDKVPEKGASGSVILSGGGKVLGMLTHRYGYAGITPSIFIASGLKAIKGGGK